MQRNHLPNADLYAKQNRRRRIWQKIVGTLACVVVFCTTYALILPAITQERESFCGYEAHTHEESCYIQTSVTKTLICTPETPCVHAHSALCYDQNGALICQLPEVAQHVHTDSCYVPAETEAPVLHVHSDACYTQEQGELICQLEKKEGHAHGASCYTTGDLTCTIPENHAHGEDCYASSLTCGQEEGEEHTHDDTCYTSSLTCAVTEGHAHGTSCYASVLICEITEEPGHTHGADCYTWNSVLTCGLEEGEAEPVPEKDPILVCTEPVLAEHVHSDGCFETVADNTLTCTLEENENHTHTALCYGTWELTCELQEHTHDLACYSDSEADVETAEIWEATFADVELTGEWYQDVLLIAESQLGYKESVKNYVVWEDGSTHGYTRYGDWYGIPHGDWCGMFVSFCLNYAGVEGMPLNYGVRPWIEDLTELELYHEAAGHEPIPGELIFFDWEGDGLSDHVGLFVEIVEATDTEPAKIKTIEGNSSNCVQYVTYDLDSEVILGYSSLPEQLSEEEQAAVDKVIALIDEMPSADEIDAKIEEFEEAEDYEGEEAWLTIVYQQVAKAYHFYDQLSDLQKSRVTNADKLLELEYIWSMTTYAATNTIPVYQINSYYPISGTDPSGYAVIMLRGGSFDELCQHEGMLDFPFNYWDAIVVEEDANGNLYIAQYDTSTGDKSTYKATTANGFVLIFTNDSTHSFYLSSLDIKVGDYVSVDFAYASYTSSSKAEYNDTTGEPYGYVTFSTSAPSTDTAGANPVTTVSSASTSDFIELNLYDYYGDASASAAGKSTVNSLWKSGSTYTGYPGFQWNGGAYPRYCYGTATTPANAGTVDRNVVDNVDFGNSIITDYKFGENTTFGNPSTTAQIVGYSNSDVRGAINRIVYYPSLPTWGVTNRPIGMSTLQDPANGTIFSEVLDRKLNSDGYPQLKTYTTGSGSLEYLFSENNYAKKINGSSIDGLFQYNETTGAYYYNSRENHAQYDSNTNTFTLYNQIITPNFILYPFGNFLPFNDITDGNKASLVGYATVDGKTYGYDYTGGGAAYIQKIINRLDAIETYNYYGFNTEEQLRYMLEKYKSNWETWSDTNSQSSGTFWSGTKTSTLINNFFNEPPPTNGGEAPNPSSGTIDFGSGTLKSIIDKMYNIDFNVEKDFFFGMDMKMNFYQPKDGMTGKDNNNDGKFDYPMEFYFTGDDDVWVYIDNILFLDLSGIHRHVGGKIDFVNGRVYYEYLNIGNGGDVGTAYTPYGATEGDYYTFAEILKAGGIAEADLGKYLKQDTSGNYTTFLDYSTHSFKFYYMERGSGSSVCRLNFNFPLIQQNTITVEKALESDVDVLGDPDFTFQVLDKATGNPFFKEHDDLDKWAYSLYDEDGNAIQSVRVVNKNPDGSIKTLEVYQGNILLMKEVDGVVTHYSDDKTVSETPNPKLLTTDENGKFTLKAGQRAEFVGIAEHWGEYYVREILPDSLDEQYDQITITGETLTETSDKVQIGTTEFVGADSSVHNSNASNSFKFTNSIDEELLSSLSIKKTVEATYSTAPTTPFQFLVTLNGETLPEGTTYDLLDADGKTVTDDKPVTVVKDDSGNVTATYVEVANGQTAVISNILAGTEFEVTEETTSSKGYTVVYSVGDTNQGATSATGTVGLNDTVEIAVTNSQIGISLEIPVMKDMSKYGSSERPYTFKILEVTDETGNTLVENGITDTKTVNLGEKPAEDAERTQTFKLSYLLTDLTLDESGNGERVYYYKISEVEGTQYIKYDDTYYIVKVTVTKDSSGMHAAVSNIWKITSDGTKTEVTGNTITFTNTILRYLVITKTVSGTDNDKSNPYNFTVTLKKGSSGTTVPTVITGYLNGASTGTEYTLTNGSFTVELKHGDSLKLVDIPYGAEWTVKEEAVGGFKTTYTITTSNGTSDSVEGNAPTGNASSTTTTVAFTNSKEYELPQTGGTGTHKYTMAGLMLVLISSTYLLYRSKKRRREVA